MGSPPTTLNHSTATSTESKQYVITNTSVAVSRSIVLALKAQDLCSCDYGTILVKVLVAVFEKQQVPANISMNIICKEALSELLLIDICASIGWDVGLSKQASTQARPCFCVDKETQKAILNAHRFHWALLALPNAISTPSSRPRKGQRCSRKIRAFSSKRCDPNMLNTSI